MDQMKGQLKTVKRIVIACGATLCLLFLVLALNQIRYLFEPGPAVPAATNTITVNGTGSVVAIPDIATFSFGVTETAATVAAAQTAASTKTNAAIDALVSAGVATSDIQTISYDINPQYETTNEPCIYNTVVPVSSGMSSGAISGGVMIPVCPSSKSVLTGYDVSETIEVKVRDISQAGTLFQTIGALGVENVNDLQFSIDNMEAVQDQARSAAIADARTNASELASELGVSLVRIVGFSDNSGGGVVPLMYASNAMVASASAAPAPSIPQGQQKVTDNVSVTYEIR